MKVVDGESLPVGLLCPYPAAEMTVKVADKDVNQVRNNHAELLNSAWGSFLAAFLNFTHRAF